MADIGGAGKVTFDRFPVANEAAVRAVSKAVRAIAFGVQESAIERIREQDAIDTGAMRNSVYVETDEVNERASKLAAAIAAGGSPGIHSGKPHHVVPASPNGSGLEELQARVGVCVEYGVYVEMGTVKMAARPFMAPAGEEMQKLAQGVAAQFLADELGNA